MHIIWKPKASSKELSWKNHKVKNRSIIGQIEPVEPNLDMHLIRFTMSSEVVTLRYVVGVDKTSSSPEVRAGELNGEHPAKSKPKQDTRQLCKCSS